MLMCIVNFQGQNNNNKKDVVILRFIFLSNFFGGVIFKTNIVCVCCTVLLAQLR